MQITETSIHFQKDMHDTAVILGFSINNSYFKAENIKQLITWALSNSKRVYIMIPDEPMVHTFMAMGETEENAKRKARLKSNNLENKCLNFIAQLPVDCITIIRWKNLANKVAYFRSYALIFEEYAHSFRFQQAIRNATTIVLSSNGVLDPTQEVLNISVQLLLKELAFITYATEILGKQKIAYVYHKTTQILKDIIEGKYKFKALSGVGFITLV